MGSKKLEFGDCIDILGLRLVFLDHYLAINTAYINVEVTPALPVCSPEAIELAAADKKKHKARDKKLNYFKRSPRSVVKLYDEPVEIEAPPQPNKQRKQPLLMTIGPSLTMMIPMMLGSGIAIFSAASSGQNASTFMYTGIITAVASAVIGVTWALVNLKYSKKIIEEDEKHRVEQYNDYLDKIAEKLKYQYLENSNILHNRYPATSICCGYDRNTPLMWNRNFTHSDFLFERVGLGSIPFQVPIIVPKDKFTLTNDALAEKPKLIKQSYCTLMNVPVGVDLKEKRLLGIYGSDGKASAFSIARAIAVQIAANNCYTDVKMMFLFDQKNAKVWEFARWLPHVWSTDKKMRYVASNKNEVSDVLYALAGLLRIRAEERQNTARRIPKPYYVVFVEDPEMLEGEPAAKYLLDSEVSYGVSVVLMSESYEALPNSCTDIIQNDSFFKGMYDVKNVDANKAKVEFDVISPTDAERFARRLSSIEVNEIETGGEIANSLTFFDMYGASSLDEFNVEDRWRKNRTYENMRALIGHKAGSAGVYLDIHEKYHGPHGLVAGTTGSGLQRRRDGESI